MSSGVKIGRHDRSENERKLLEQRAELEALKESMRKTKDLGSRMADLLSSLDTRLSALEVEVLPVHHSTQKLSRLLANIGTSLESTAKVITYLDVAQEEEPIIMSRPRVDTLDSYLTSLVRMQDAVEYLSKSELKCKDKQLTKLRQLHRAGLLELVNLFRNLLTEQSEPVEVRRLLQGGLGSAPLPTDVAMATIGNLLSIIERLRDESQVGDFEVVWSEIRTNYLQSSLKKPSMTMKRKKKEVKPMLLRSQKQLGQAFSSESSFQGSASPLNMSLNASGRSDEYGQSQDADSDKLTFTEYCIWMVRFFKAEQEFLKHVYPSQHSWQPTFTSTISPVLDQFLESGEMMVQSVRTTMERNSYYSADVFVVYEVFESLVKSKKEVDEFVAGGAGAVKTKTDKISSLISEFLETCVKGCHGFLGDLRASAISQVQEALPADGTVHSQTSDVVNFLKRLLLIPVSSDQILTSALASEKVAFKTGRAVPGEPSGAQRLFFTESLNALIASLEAKAKQYRKSPALSGIFMMNNYQYVWKSCTLPPPPEVPNSYSFRQVVGEDFVESISAAIKKQQQIYQESLNPLITVLMDVTIIHDGRIKTSMSNRERENVKEKFKGFNEQFEDLCRSQNRYIIADPELRRTVRQEVKKVILPMYGRFHEKYHASNFSSNTAKYVKYDRAQVERMIDRLFEGKDI